MPTFDPTRFDNEFLGSVINSLRSEIPFSNELYDKIMYTIKKNLPHNSTVDDEPREGHRLDSSKPNFTLKSPANCMGSQGPCNNTECEWFHLSTRYIEESRNWSYMCKKCKKLELEFWDDMWSNVPGYC